MSWDQISVFSATREFSNGVARCRTCDVEAVVDHHTRLCRSCWRWWAWGGWMARVLVEAARRALASRGSMPEVLKKFAEEVGKSPEREIMSDEGRQG